ncbi:uncharacterized protein B0H64DRAFT_400275 [Chaetomium fimeti]|uniref:Uncharacterized protein n=1 Tax=Chaetomium fimeti TaxID=1854472 RepID=A0AAE0LQZ5_9PEZI|nr:hypothetical protein B0H64DRAFT_400275 [Chaetomium fimeti]
MSLASDLYNMFVPRRQPPPPYNKVAKLAMTVEVETRRLETVEGDGTVLRREITTMSHQSSGGGSSWSTSSSSSTFSAVSGPEQQSLPRQLHGRWAKRSICSSPESLPSLRRSDSLSSVSSCGSFGSGSNSESGSEIRVVGVVKSGGEMKMFEGGGVVVEDRLEGATSPASWPESVKKLAGRGRNIGVVYNSGPPYAGWTPKKNKFTRRESDHTVYPNYRAMHLAEAEEKRKKLEGRSVSI